MAGYPTVSLMCFSQMYFLIVLLPCCISALICPFQLYFSAVFLNCISQLYFRPPPYISNGCSHTPLWPLNVGRQRIHGSETILTDLPLWLLFRKLEITVGGTAGICSALKYKYSCVESDGNGRSCLCLLNRFNPLTVPADGAPLWNNRALFFQAKYNSLCLSKVS